MAARAYEINGDAVDASQFIAVACDPSRSVAVEACAGSGKTWLLVARMLRLLLAGAEPSELLPDPAGQLPLRGSWLPSAALVAASSWILAGLIDFGQEPAQMPELLAVD